MIEGSTGKFNEVRLLDSPRRLREEWRQVSVNAF